MKLTVLDGAGCIGGNKIHVAMDGVGLMLDFGLNFSKFGQFYEEFVRPRGTRGLFDLIALDLLPCLGGVYRSDLFPSGFEVPNPLECKVDAVLLSHAHLDHMGSVSFLEPGIPIYCSGMTAVIMKAMQDCGKSEFDREYAYVCRRQPNPQGALVSGRGSRELRNVKIVVDKEMGPLNEFWTRSFSTSTIYGPPLEKAGADIVGVPYRAYPVGHSVLGATALMVQTDAGWLAYTGDMRMHGTKAEETRAFIEEAKASKPKVLVIEGTNVGEETVVSEEDVLRKCREVCEKFKGKIIVADFGPRNVERLLIFLDIAKDIGRRLVVTMKDAFLLHAVHLADPRVPDALSDPDILIFDEMKGTYDKWESGFIRVFYASKFVTPLDIMSDRAELIVAFSYYDVKHLLDVLPGEGAYVYSQCEAFSEEMEIDLWRLSNWVRRLGLTPVGFCLPEDATRFTAPEFTPGYHSSGHMSGPELLELVRSIEPEIVVPVHTEKPEYFVDNLGPDFKVIVPVEGKAIEV